MSNLNDLITNIYADEVVPIEDSLDSAQQWRIEEQILQTIKQDSIEPTPAIKYSKKSKRKKWLLLAIAATLLFALGLTTIAAVQNEWNITLINFMGISDADTLQLESGEIQINKLAEYSCENSSEDALLQGEPIQMKVVSSIGDKNSAYIRIETNYEIPTSYNEETDYIAADNYSLKVDPMESGFSSTCTSYIENGKLGFLISISNCEKLNRCEVSVEFADLYLYHDLKEEDSNAERELLCAGTWTLTWKFHYKSSVKTYHVFEAIESNGVTYYLTKIEISPISIRMEAFRMPKDRDQIDPDALLETICFEDGSSLTVPNENNSGMRNGIFLDSYVNVSTFGNAIDANAVKSIVVCGKEIKLY